MFVVTSTTTNQKVHINKHYKFISGGKYGKLYRLILESNSIVTLEVMHVNMVRYLNWKNIKDKTNRYLICDLYIEDKTNRHLISDLCEFYV